MAQTDLIAFIPWYDWRMAVRKLTVSFDPELAEEVRRHARDEGVSVSRWLADAAARELQQRRLTEFVAEFEAEFGPITDEERADVERVWPALP